MPRIRLRQGELILWERDLRIAGIPDFSMVVNVTDNGKPGASVQLCSLHHSMPFYTDLLEPLQIELVET